MDHVRAREMDATEFSHSLPCPCAVPSLASPAYGSQPALGDHVYEVEEFDKGRGFPRISLAFSRLPYTVTVRPIGQRGRRTRE